MTDSTRALLVNRPAAVLKYAIRGLERALSTAPGVRVTVGWPRATIRDDSIHDGRQARCAPALPRHWPARSVSPAGTGWAQGTR